MFFFGMTSLVFLLKLCFFGVQVGVASAFTTALTPSAVGILSLSFGFLISY